MNTGTILDGGAVATGTTTIANFDHLGIQVTLAGPGAAGADGSYTDGDLNGATVIVEGSKGGVFQVGPSAKVVDRIEVGDGVAGPVTRRVQAHYLAVAKGEAEDRHGWLTPVVGR